MSAMNYDEEKSFTGYDQLVIGGYDGIVRGLLSGLNIVLKLQRVVSEIDYYSSNVTVKMTDGSWV